MLAPTALLALAPKCVLCVLAYAGLGAALGIRDPEICGETAGPRGPWAPALAAIGVALASLALLAALRRLRGPGPSRRGCT